MTGFLGASVGLVGALAGLPRRLAAREVAAQGGRLHRDAARGTDIVVFGRRLLARASEAEIAARIAGARAPGRTLMSEAGFLRRLAGKPVGEPGLLGRATLAEQSGLAPAVVEALALFDGFSRDAEPFALRDLILARKYAGLLAGGAGWGAIVRSVHRFGPAVSLTAASLRLGDEGGIYAAHGDGLAELDGQLLFGFAEAGDDADALFAEAETAEAAGRHAEAAALYARVLAADPGDAVAAFNRANCLAAAGRGSEAEAELARALKLDPGFVEAWFNLAGLLAERGSVEAACAYLGRALAVDPGYADAVFNLAGLQFAAGRHAEAEAGWRRYLELDATSEWARKAERGLRYLALAAAHGAEA